MKNEICKTCGKRTVGTTNEQLMATAKLLKKSVKLLTLITSEVEKECRRDLKLMDMEEPDNDEKWTELIPFDEYWDILKFLEKCKY